MNNQINILHSSGMSIREISVKLNLSYAYVYNQIENYQSETDQLKETIAELKVIVTGLKDENEKLKNSLSDTNNKLLVTRAALSEAMAKKQPNDNYSIGLQEKLNQAEYNIKRLTIKTMYLQKVYDKTKAENEQLKEDYQSMLCQESKALGWQAWRQK